MWLLNPYRFGESDPFFNNVSLLLTGNGTNGSTSIIDSSPSPKTMTAFGNAQISTATSKFGGGSIYLDGAGDWLTTPSSNDFAYGTGDFTLEGWLNVSAVGTDRIIWDQRVNPADTGIVFFIDPNGRLNSYQGVNLNANSGSLLLQVGVWHHFCYVRRSGVLNVYIDGQLGGSAALTTSLTSPGTVRIGVRQDNAFPYNGYIELLRVTKGVARYQSAFTPPTAPFPTS